MGPSGPTNRSHGVSGGPADTMDEHLQVNLRPELRELNARLSETTLTLLAAPGGSGKTTLAKEWADHSVQTARPIAWLSITPVHADLALFLEDLLAALRPVVERGDSAPPAFGESIERLLTLRIDLDPAQVVRRLAIESRTLANAPVICLDGYEHLPAESPSATVVDRLLRIDPCPIRLVITTRGSRPPASTLLVAAGRAIEIGAEDLSLRTAQVTDLLRFEGVDPEPEIVSGLIGRTQGWAMAIRLMARTLAGLPRDDRAAAVRELGGQRDLFDYIGSEIVGRTSEACRAILEAAARIGPAPAESLLAAADPSRDARQGLRDALDAGLLIEDGARLALHDLWREWLRSPLRTRRNPAAEQAIDLRMGAALERIGDFERALSRFVEALPHAEAETGVARILAEHGHGWTSAGRRAIVETALTRLPEETRRHDMRLNALEGLLLAGSDPDRAIAHLEAACSAYHEAGMLREESMCLHELGVVAISENRPRVLLRLRRRMLAVGRSSTDASMRGMIFLGLGATSLLMHRYSAALRFLNTAETFDHHPRERGGIGVLRSTILVYQGRWQEADRRIEAILSRPEQRQHGASYSMLRMYQAMMNSARDLEPERQQTLFEEACDFFSQCHYTDNRIRSELAYGHHLHRNGEPTLARERFETAETLAHKIRLHEAVAAARGSIARARQLAGDREAARATALAALDGLDRPKAWSITRGMAHAWIPGISLACAVLAETGEAERAWRFIERHRKYFQLPKLAVCQHMALAIRAHCAASSDRAAEADEARRSAWQSADRARIEGFALEFDAELLGRCATDARRAGLEGRMLERAAARTTAPESAKIMFHTLGGFEARTERGRVPDRAWRGQTSRRLLARLLTSGGHPLARERIETSLWPDVSASRARSNLRTALLRLRDALEPRRRRSREPGGVAIIVTEGDRIGLSKAAFAGWDVTLWREALESAERATRESRVRDATAALETIERLDRGEFLPELDDDWVRETRSRLEWDRTRVGRELAVSWTDRGEYGLATRFARFVLSRSPEDEPTWIVLVRAHLAADDVLAARSALREARERLGGRSSTEIDALEARV